MPLVSIVVPVFNASATIEEAVRSVLIQSLRAWELILVDDGSVDGSSVLLDGIAAKDPRLRVITQKNLGPGVARNVGLSAARGKYVLFLDADDMLASETILDRVIAKADATSCDCLLAGARELTSEGVSGGMLKWCLRTDLIPSKEVFNGKSAGLGLFSMAGAVSWAKLFRREFILRHELVFPPLKRSEDFPFVQLALALAQRLTAFFEPMVLHRVSVAGSLESTKDETPCIFAKGERFFISELRRRGLEREFAGAARIRALLRLDYNLRAMRSYSGRKAVFEYACEERGKLEVPGAGERFSDYLEAKVNVDRILAFGSVGEWLSKSLAEAETRLLRCSIELRDCRVKIKSLSEREKKLDEAIAQLAKDYRKACFGEMIFACRVGMFATWPIRKVWGGIKCLRENGFKYTAKHFVGKVARTLGLRSVKW